ncbi:MAG: methylenetetrahydrofolate reductase [NAD(P)H], partial [Bacteroidales bacterium]
MKVIEMIQTAKKTAFSFEILPPLKGSNIEKVFRTIDMLREFDPKYINITTHRSEVVYKTIENGLFRPVVERNRPGTVAIAAAIQSKYGITAVPHVICSGFTKTETEYLLIDLKFLGITDLLVLRGDKAKSDKNFKADEDGHRYAIDLQQQVNQFNQGIFLDGSKVEPSTPFSYGVAGYPEKHDEAPNIDSDIHWLKEKVKAGAEYVVTQMFFDNQKYFDFVDRCRAEGITVPIIPGLKPLTVPDQMTVLPKIFHVDIPEAFTKELRKCDNDEAVRQVGMEWCTQQAKELIQHGVPSIHFYTLMATKSVKEVAQAVY